MTDIVDTKTRSRMMSGIKGKNTKPELLIRRELLNIIEMRCEENRVSFRSINPYKTSQQCPHCSHTERGNRVAEKFQCLRCGYSNHADIVGSLNILTRFTTGRYGAGFKTELMLSNTIS